MKSFIAAVAFATLAGCDGGFDGVGAAMKDRGLEEEIKWIRTEVPESWCGNGLPSA